MRRNPVLASLLLLGYLLFGETGAAQAQCAAVPNHLANATTADANDVMGDFNALLTCINNRPGGPNLLINPSMDIDQANEGIAITVTTGGPIIDGWRGNVSNRSYSVSMGRQTISSPSGCTTQFANTYHMAITSAGTGPATGESLVATQQIEAFQITNTAFGTSSAQTLSLSFCASASVSGTYAVSLRNGAGTRSYILPVALTSIPTWFSFIIPGDTGGTWVLTGNTTGMILGYGLTAGSSLQTTSGTWQPGNFTGVGGQSQLSLTNGATFDLTGVKLEISPVSTPFVRRDFATEVALAQRYYGKSYDLGTTLGTVTNNGANYVSNNGSALTGSMVAFKTTMRCDASIATYSPGTGTAAKARDYVNSSDVTPTINNIGAAGFGWEATASAGTQGHFGLHWTADCRL